MEVPYRSGSTTRSYIPDFIVVLDDGRDDPLHLVVEIKGYRGEDAKEKKETMETYWIPGVNNLDIYGCWAFAEFTDVYEIQSDFEALMEKAFNEMIHNAITEPEQSANEPMSVIRDLQGRIFTGGRKFSRDEMNER